MLLIFLPMLILLAIFAKPLIVILYGQEFVQSGTVLLILLPGAFLLGLEVIAAGDIAGRGYPWPAALVWIPLFGLNVLGYLLLIPRFGINGAALSTTITFALAFIYLTAYLKKMSGFSLRQMFVPRLEDVRTMVKSFSRALRGGE